MNLHVFAFLGKTNISNDKQNDIADDIYYYVTSFKSLIPTGKERAISVDISVFLTLDSCFKRALCVPAGEGLNQWQRWLSIFFPLEYTTSRLIACINNKPRRGYFGGRFVDHKLINRELFCFSFHISRRYVQDYQDIRAIRIEGIFKDLSQPQTSTCSK